jgi:hypothetical protein
MDGELILDECKSFPDLKINLHLLRRITDARLWLRIVGPTIWSKPYMSLLTMTEDVDGYTRPLGIGIPALLLTTMITGQLILARPLQGLWMS